MKQIKRYSLAFILLLLLFSQKGMAQSDQLFDRNYIKATLLKVADWQLKHSNGQTENSWTNGAFYTGVMAAYKTTKSPVLLDSLMAIGNRHNWLPEKRFDHADDIVISQTYLDLFRLKKDGGMIQPTIDSVNKMRTTPGKEVKNHGITWWWCDALFMAPPTLAKIAAIKKDPSYLVLNDTLFHQTYRLLYNQKEHLFARDATYLVDANGNGKKEANGQKVFWSRGNGWVMAGLARLLQEMPKNYGGRAFYVNLFKEMSARLITLQQPDGLWRTSLLDPASYAGGEGSGTGFYCFALAWGINNKILDKATYLPVVQKSWTALTGIVTTEGKVGWVQPIGADPRKNFNSESWESYGAGAFMLAGSEVIKLKK